MTIETNKRYDILKVSQNIKEVDFDYLSNPRFEKHTKLTDIIPILKGTRKTPDEITKATEQSKKMKQNKVYRDDMY